MRRTSRILFFAVAIAALNILFLNMDDPGSQAGRGKGLAPFTAEEAAKLSKRKIKSVRPNQRAFDRVNEERRRRDQTPLPVSDRVGREPEIEVESSDPVQGGAKAGSLSTSGGGSTTMSAVPAQVDNSALPAFPKIGNQGSLPSCVGWALTYYQMSHQVCLQLGCDNKTALSRVYSPRWTYNLINGGKAVGTYFSDGFAVMERHGAALNAEFPYSSSEYRAWDLNPEHWRSAINSRMSPASSVAISTDSGMANVKQLLANGNVLIMGTYIDSWVYGTVAANPNSAENPFVGQKITTYQKGTAGAHAMTIVGYDDRIWVDINANGVVDAAEVGAFKVANSWGTSYGNAGFIWISYDAFRPVSAISGFAPSGRNGLTQGGVAYLITYTPYSPKLLARVTASHVARSQVGLQFGSSSSTATSPQLSWVPKALSYTGGAYAFNGTTTEVEGTFYFDISSLYSATSVDQQIFYLTMTDNTAGSALTVRSFEVVDPANGNAYAVAANVPVAVDGSNTRLTIGSYTADTQAPTAPSGLAAVKVLGKGKRAKTSINLSWKAATDNVAVAKYIVYRSGKKLAETTSLAYSDSTGTAGVSYTYEVSAVDSSGNESPKSVSVSIVN